MFTGIVEETGKIHTINPSLIEVACKNILSDASVGDSIAVNGVCLTLTNIRDYSFVADISPETYDVTNFYKLKQGDIVNLERACKVDGRLGGHIVSGHIDGVAKVCNVKQNQEFYDLELELSESESKYVIRKGSIAVNGISLTIANVKDNFVKIAVIPHTYEFTNLCKLKLGDYVNIEVDVLAKYVEKILSVRDNRTGINMDFLERNGFC